MDAVVSAVSAVTVVELAYLAEKGTLNEAEVDAVHAVLDAAGTSFDVVPMDHAVAWAVGRVPRDPSPIPGTMCPQNCDTLPGWR